MPWFEYEGLTPGGTAIAGRLEAVGHDQAAQDLALMQIQVRQLEVAPAVESSAKLSSDDLIFFNEQLASLAEAGIALDEGLAQLARDIESSNLKKWVSEIAGDLRRGIPVDQAIAAREKGIPILYSRVIRAGIQTGQLPATLLNLNQHLRLAGETRRLVWELAAYPILIAALALIISSAFFIYVVPQFKDIFRDFGTQLPLVTRWVIEIAAIYPHILLSGAILIVVLILFWRGLAHSPSGRVTRERFLLSMPLVGDLTRCSIIARFLRMISITVGGGVPMPDALRLSADATGSSIMIRDADRIAAEIERGESIFAANQSARIIPPLFGFCAQVAQGRGALPAAIAQLAQAYENRAVHALAMLRVILFPVLIVLLGVFLFIGVGAMFLPLVTLINSVSGGG